jgi:lambda family phage tail tape measure protein
MAAIDNYTVNIQVKGEQDLKNATTNTNNLSKSINDLNNQHLKQVTSNFGESSNAIQHFNEKMEGIKQKAEGLAVALVGIGMIEFIHKIGEAAAQTKDLSEAFGLNISTVLEMQAGFARAGKDAGDMSKMMTALNQKAIEAADGNLKVKNAFADLGVTTKDLRSQSMDQIFLTIAKSMEAGKGSAASLAASMEILGKGAKGTPWGDYVEGVDKVKGSMGDAAKGVEAFDTSMKKMEEQAAAVKREFMVILTPVVEFFNGMSEGSGHAKEAAELLAGAMALITGAIVIKGVAAIADAYKGFAAMLGLSTVAAGAETTALAANTVVQAQNAAVRAAGIGAKVASLESSLANARAILAETVAEEGNLLATAELTAARRVLMIQTSQLATAQALLAESSVAATVGIAAEGAAAVVAAPAVTGLSAATGLLSAALIRLAPFAIAAGAAMAVFYSGDLNKGEDEQLKQIHKLEDAIMSMPKEQQEAYFKMSDAEKKRVAEAVKNGKAIKDAMSGGAGDSGKPGDKPVLPAGKDKNQQAATEEALRIQYDLQTLTNSQTEKRLKLQADIIGLSEIEKTQKLAAYDEQAKKQQEIQKLVGEISKMEVQSRNDPDGSAKYAGQLTIMRNQLTIVSQTIGKTAELTTQLKMAEQVQAKVLFSRQLEFKAADDVLKIQNEINGLTMTGDQLKMASIQQQIQAEAKLEVKRREALLGNGAKLPLLEQIEILHQVEAAYDPVLAKQNELIDKSRSFETGWSKAFNSYMDDSTNAAKKGEQMFTNMTSTLNSSIDNFVTTGKFSFGDFTTSLIQDMLKIELKASAMNLMKMMGSSGGGGGFLSSIGKMLGFAGGGDPPVGVPSIVGENGPEIFIPKQAGTIIPNGGAMTGAASAPPVTNNYYTVNAVDAKSVAQLFAENRKTLLGSVKMAEKELPYKLR